MTPAEEFEELRALLFSIAYRILGSVSEAEDAVQETWLRYESSSTKPASAKAFLSAVVTRISIDVLRSARVRREKYVGQWFPEPLLTDPYEDPARSAELAARFFDALRDGDIDGVRELLAADVQLVGDGGGKAPALARSVVGADNAARLLASIFPVLARMHASVEARELNGQPGAILRDRDGKVVSTFALDTLDGRIQTTARCSTPTSSGTSVRSGTPGRSPASCSRPAGSQTDLTTQRGPGGRRRFRSARRRPASRV